MFDIHSFGLIILQVSWQQEVQRNKKMEKLIKEGGCKQLFFNMYGYIVVCTHSIIVLSKP